MTMHLMSHAYTTTSTKNRKSKKPTITSKYASEYIDYNKQQRRYGLKEKTIEEYIAYRQGKSTYKPKTVPEPLKTETYRRQTPDYPSGDGIGVTFAKKPNEYTGTLIKGIATMHKSNAVPVINQQQAEEISKMRR